PPGMRRSGSPRSRPVLRARRWRLEYRPKESRRLAHRSRAAPSNAALVRPSESDLSRETLPHVLVVVFEMTARGLDDEVADDRPGERRSDADDADPVRPDQNPLFGCRPRQPRKEDLSRHAGRPMRNAKPANPLARRLR